MERQGLVGAMPIGMRWRAQGYINGSVRYLGTFDTEQEAHEVFVEASSAAREKEREDASAEFTELRALVEASPEFVYEGGVGRGAALNGRRFRLVQEDDGRSSHLIVTEVVASPGGGPIIVLAENRPLLRTYLRPSDRTAGIRYVLKAEHVELEPETEHVVAREAARETHGHMNSDPVLRALDSIAGLTDPAVLATLPKEVADRLLAARGDLVDGTRVANDARQKRLAMKRDVYRLLTEPKHDLWWSIGFLERHLNPGSEAMDALAVVKGTGIDETLTFLREHADVPDEILDELSKELIEDIFDRGEAAMRETVERAYGPRGGRVLSPPAETGEALGDKALFNEDLG